MKRYGMTIEIKPFQEHFGSVPICFHFVADINHFRKPFRPKSEEITG